MNESQVHISDDCSLDVLPIRSSTDTVVAGALATDRCLTMGFSARASREVGIAAAELASNILRHAQRGKLEIDVTLARATLVATDDGPGIDNPEAALQDRFSRGRMRDDSEGPLVSLGCGLGAVERLMSTLQISPRPGGGTVVRATKWGETDLSWW